MAAVTVRLSTETATRPASVAVSASTSPGAGAGARARASARARQPRAQRLRHNPQQSTGAERRDRPPVLRWPLVRPAHRCCPQCGFRRPLTLHSRPAHRGGPRRGLSRTLMRPAHRDRPRPGLCRPLAWRYGPYIAAAIRVAFAGL